MPGTVVDRNKELDAMRGVAALAVLLFHALATNITAFDRGYRLLPVEDPVVNVLSYTPLHILWVGAEAVWFFFVLSGFVLTRSASREGFRWDAYYPSRIVRLYLPVLFAIALAWLNYLLVPHIVTPAHGTALDGAATSYPLGSVVMDATLIGGTTTSLGVLWSLQWEVIFSLALPLYLYLVRKHSLIAGLLAAAVCFVGWWLNNPATSFLPMFFFGCLLAQHWHRIVKAFGYLRRGGPMSIVLGALTLALAITATTCYYLIGAEIAQLGLPPRAITVLPAMAGICLILIVGILWHPIRAVLLTRPLLFLGDISYSLYLVHLPIVVAFAFVMERGVWATVAGVALSLVVGYLFHIAIERPAHRLARRINSEVKATEPATAPSRSEHRS